MQYRFIPAFISATGMLASAAPVSKASNGIVPEAPAATRPCHMMNITWQPDLSGSSDWKKMDISLVEVDATGKHLVKKVASNVDGTKTGDNRVSIKAPYSTGKNQFVVVFSDGKHKKESPAFVIEKKDSTYAATPAAQHARRSHHSSSSTSSATDMVSEDGPWGF